MRRDGNRNEEEEKEKEESTNHHIFMVRCRHEIAVLYGTVSMPKCIL